VLKQTMIAAACLLALTVDVQAQAAPDSATVAANIEMQQVIGMTAEERAAYYHAKAEAETAIRDSVAKEEARANAARTKRNVARWQQAGWSQRAIKAVLAEKIYLGMTPEQVRASWGEPDDINRTLSTYGTKEQWVYRDADAYVYFRDGRVTTIQD
jgi:hypothetical protein